MCEIHDQQAKTAEAEIERLREQLSEAQIGLSMREADLDEANEAIQALGENPSEAGLWAQMKGQRDAAIKRAEDAEQKARNA